MRDIGNLSHGEIKAAEIASQDPYDSLSHMLSLYKQGDVNLFGADPPA
jgi:hypothetical protein